MYTSAFSTLIELVVHKVERSLPVTFPIGVGALLNGIRVLDYLYAEEKEDYRRSRFSRARLISGALGLVEFDEIRTRFVSRITSYIITACTIDRILEQSYKHFNKYLVQIGYEEMLPPNNIDILLDERKAEIKNFTFYRNKVFAHTAFDSPREGDSHSLRYSSLWYFSGDLLYVKDKYLALGGGSMIIDREENPPELSIITSYRSLGKHYSMWQNMFTGVLKKIPPDELKSKVDRTDIL